MRLLSQMTLRRRIATIVWTGLLATSAISMFGEWLGHDVHLAIHILTPLIVGALITMWLNRKILRRLEALSAKLEQIAEDERLTVPERPLTHDEIDQVTVSVESLLQKTQARVLSLRKRKAYIRAILDAIPGHVSWIKRDLTYRGVNSAFAEFNGQTTEAFAGQPVGFEEHGQGGSFREIVAEFFASESKSMHREIETKDHKGLPLTWYVSGQKYADGNEAVFVGMDVSGIRKLELEVTKQREKNANAARLAALGEMAGGVAHEINNPLAIITNKSYVIRKLSETGSLTNEKLTHELEVIERTARRISKIVTGMRRFARDGKRDPFQKHSVHQIISDTVDICQARIKASGVQLILATPMDQHRDHSDAHHPQDHEALPSDETDIVVDCRPTQISQVLLNLITNAWHAAKEHPGGWIRIEHRQRGNIVELRVIDSGTGIPKDMREKLFAPFFTTKDPDRGTGLGLSISHGIIKDHGGEILLDHTAQNTTFVVRLPVRQLLVANDAADSPGAADAA